MNAERWEGHSAVSHTRSDTVPSGSDSRAARVTRGRGAEVLLIQLCSATWGQGVKLSPAL